MLTLLRQTLALALMVMAVLPPIAPAAAGLARQSLFAICQILKRNEACTSSRPTGIESKTIRAMLARHNRYVAEFARWRGLFARHAAALAALVKTFPGSEDLSEAHLRRLIAQTPGSYGDENESRIFQPWTNRWAGWWSNGAPQYHVRDTTRCLDGQRIQPVSLSEYGFVAPAHLDASVRRSRADAALNVFTRGHGVTGWVSRYQHGRVEMPHPRSKDAAKMRTRCRARHTLYT